MIMSYKSEKIRFFQEDDFIFSSFWNSLADFSEDDFLINDDEVVIKLIKNCYLVRSDRGYVVFDSELNLVKESLLKRSGIGQKSVYLKPSKYYYEGCVLSAAIGNKTFNVLNSDIEINQLAFLGNPHSEFGHCVTECLSRFWSLKELKNVPLFMSNFISNKIWMDIIGIFGLRFDKFFMPPAFSVIKIRELYLPMAGMNLFGRYSKKMKSVWDDFSDRACLGENKFNSKIYLSRSGFRRNLLNESLIKNFYVGKGYQVISPEKMSIKDQISCAASSEHVVGVVGSQMHLGQFQRNGKITIFGHSGFFPVDFACVASIKNQELEAFIAKGNYVSKNEAIKSDFVFSEKFLDQALFRKD